MLTVMYKKIAKILGFTFLPSPFSQIVYVDLKMLKERGKEKRRQVFWLDFLSLISTILVKFMVTTRFPIVSPFGTTT